MPKFLDENPGLSSALLDILPNPVLVKNADLTYVWVNSAFEDLFDVKREDLIGRLDKDVFQERQATQCNGGDLRVLATGEVDEAYETVFRNGTEPRVTLTRKSRLSLNGRQLLIGVMHDVTDVTKANEKLRMTATALAEQSEILSAMAKRDALTGCLNRRALFEMAESQFARYGNRGGVLVLDIDFFKSVNDRFGHGGGDASLVHFSAIVQSQLRAKDTFVRMGGEEFAILLPGATPQETQHVANRICNIVAETPAEYEDSKIELTVSIGAVHARDDTDFDLQALLSRADTSLYQAKTAGRNRVALAS